MPGPTAAGQGLLGRRESVATGKSQALRGGAAIRWFRSLDGLLLQPAATRT